MLRIISAHEKRLLCGKLVFRTLRFYHKYRPAVDIKRDRNGRYALVGTPGAVNQALSDIAGQTVPRLGLYKRHPTCGLSCVITGKRPGERK